jgi:hypothetical protein
MLTFLLLTYSLSQNTSQTPTGSYFSLSFFFFLFFVFQVLTNLKSKNQAKSSKQNKPAGISNIYNNKIILMSPFKKKKIILMRIFPASLWNHVFYGKFKAYIIKFCLLSPNLKDQYHITKNDF